MSAQRRLFVTLNSFQGPGPLGAKHFWMLKQVQHDEFADIGSTA